MAGIYIHIPFCKSKCFYCDFYSVARLNKKKDYIEALLYEVENQQNYLDGELIETIYFGGGTPSLLTIYEINLIIDKIAALFKIAVNPEITLELNPDDITPEFAKDLKNKTAVNRVSIGIQSFFDEDLKLMNRRHNANQSIDSVKLLNQVGFENISIDLIYGLPSLNVDKWKSNLQQAFELPVQHISAYHLTYEPNTVFERKIRDKKIIPLLEEESILQYKMLVYNMKNNDFVQYEISNFAKKNYESKHNTNYWKQKKYLGLGASAHSYNGNSRQWNINDVQVYIDCILNKKEGLFSSENLSLTDQYNEYIMTSLRTIWGLDLNYVETQFGVQFKNQCLSFANTYLELGFIVKNENKLTLSEEGKLISDRIILEMFK